MIEVNEICKGQEPVSGVILTVNEFEELKGAYKDIRLQAKEAEAASKATDERLEALRNESRKKEASIDALQADLDELKGSMTYLNNRLDSEERLNAALMKVKEEAR